MDESYFDAFARSVARRGLPRRLLGLPLLAGLLANLDPDSATAEDDDHGSSHRRRRRRTRHKHRKNTVRRNKKHKKRKKRKPKTRCTPRSCPAGRCGSLANGCGGTMQCGCGANQLCDDGVCRDCTVTCPGGDCDGAVDLQPALLAGGTIYACPGVYRGNFVVPSTSVGITVTLVGAGEGNDPQRDTILDGNAADRVLTIPREVGLTGATVELRRVRIRNGEVVSSVGGAGILHDGRRLTMRECTVTDNHVSRTDNTNVTGGGILNFRELLMTDCTVSGNSVTQTGVNTSQAAGGGMFVSNGSGIRVELTRCRIVDNTATAGDATLGGGIYLGGSVTLTDCEITGNQLLDAFARLGSGLFLDHGGEVELVNSDLSGNTPDPQCYQEVADSGCPA